MNLTDAQFKAWMSALRSGDYKQGHYFLCIITQPTTYCCLGVYGRAVTGKSDTRMIHSKWLRTVEDTPSFTPAEEQILARCNDRFNLTFSQIAAFIEGGGIELWDRTGQR